MKYCRGCSAPFLPTDAEPDYCDFCICFPELRRDRNPLNNPTRNNGGTHTFKQRRKAQLRAKRRARHKRPIAE